jgi:hypothetical protein
LALVYTLQGASDVDRSALLPDRVLPAATPKYIRPKPVKWLTQVNSPVQPLL